VLTIKKPKYIFVVNIFRDRLRIVFEFNSPAFQILWPSGPVISWSQHS